MMYLALELINFNINSYCINITLKTFYLMCAPIFNIENEKQILYLFLYLGM
jgi:hypothetical protein